MKGDVVSSQRDESEQSVGGVNKGVAIISSTLVVQELDEQGISPTLPLARHFGVEDPLARARGYVKGVESDEDGKSREGPDEVTSDGRVFASSNLGEGKTSLSDGVSEASSRTKDSEEEDEEENEKSSEGEGNKVEVASEEDSVEICTEDGVKEKQGPNFRKELGKVRLT
ncbi:hypothetical protein U1Q18_031239 [Sarracenia purpurea var. burkii]